MGTAESPIPNRSPRTVNPNVAKAGGFQSQGAKGDAVVLYCNPLATRVVDPVEDGDFESSLFNIFGHFDLILTHDFDRFGHTILIFSIHTINFYVF